MPGKGQWLGALEVQRASIRGTAVQLSRTQFPDLYASVDDFAATLGVKPAPAVYLSNGNGTLNAFAAQSGWTNNYVVLSSDRSHPARAWRPRRTRAARHRGRYGGDRLGRWRG